MDSSAGSTYFKASHSIPKGTTHFGGQDWQHGAAEKDNPDGSYERSEQLLNNLVLWPDRNVH